MAPSCPVTGSFRESATPAGAASEWWWVGGGGQPGGCGDHERAVGCEVVGAADGLVFAAVVGGAEAGHVARRGAPLGIAPVVVQLAGAGHAVAAAGLAAAPVAGAQEPVQLRARPVAVAVRRRTQSLSGFHAG